MEPITLLPVPVRVAIECLGNGPDREITESRLLGLIDAYLQRSALADCSERGAWERSAWAHARQMYRYRIDANA